MISTELLYNEFQSLQQNRKRNNEWLESVRSSAFEAFQRQGFPDIKKEDWRFTNILPFLKEDYQVPVDISAFKETTLPVIPSLDAHKIILQNGRLHTAPSIAGIKILPLTKALSNSELHSYFGRHILLNEQPFAALNTAFFEDGILIEIDKNAIVDKPLHIIHQYYHQQAGFIQPRVLIVANQNSKADIIETVTMSDGTPLFVNTVSEYYVKDNAQLSHYNIQLAPAAGRFVNFTQAVQDANSLFNSYVYTLPGAAFVRNNLHIALKGNNTETHLYGLYLGGHGQLIDNHSLVDHRQPNCMSNQLYKGVLTGNAKAVFNGKIYVHQAAQKTNAFQQNNNLLLSDKAVVDSKPQLEIFADDVKCSHGSTTGNFNNDALFYLKTRGIGEEKARKLLVNAFAFDVTNKIKIPALQKHVEKLISEGMN